MILQALNRYYDILTEDPDSGIALEGYSVTQVSFALNISIDGELLDIFPLFDKVQIGKKTEEKPRRMVLPAQIKKTIGIAANFLCENAMYILAISKKGDLEYAKKRQAEFVRHNTRILSSVDSPAAHAVVNFLQKFNPDTAAAHPVLAPVHAELLNGGNLVFMFEGNFAHEDTAIRQAWEHSNLSDTNAIYKQCLVTGQVAPVARLHSNLKGIRDANSTGATLVGFNAAAYQSYNLEQGNIAPISEAASFAYTTVLNYMLAGTGATKKFYLGDTTVVYWAESPNKQYAQAFYSLCEPEFVEEENLASDVAIASQNAGRSIRKVAEKVRRVQKLDLDAIIKDLDSDTRFYVLGLSPNASRISVRFFHSDLFKNVVANIMQHYHDLNIEKEFENEPDYLTVRTIVDQTISPKASDRKASPLLAGAVFRAILQNTPYPAALYNAIINRIRADADDKDKFIAKINHIRAAIIKAYLLRKYRLQPNHSIQESLTMSLNPDCKNQAYLLGRLFAVLESAQKDAIGDVNASIKDRYFTSACASPSTVFPVLLRLAQHHLTKGEYGKNNDRRIQDILDLLEIQENPIPARLTLDQQGVFILGYYHQRANFYVSKTKNDNIPTV